MSNINMLPSVMFKGDEDYSLTRLQKRFEEPLQALINLPWADGALVTGVAVPLVGVNTITLVHRLGRPARGVVLARATYETSAPFALKNTTSVACTVQVRAATAAGTIDCWVY